eukprot:gene10792-biopygen9363
MRRVRRAAPARSRRQAARGGEEWTRGQRLPGAAPRTSFLNRQRCSPCRTLGNGHYFILNAHKPGFHHVLETRFFGHTGRGPGVAWVNSWCFEKI